MTTTRSDDGAAEAHGDETMSNITGARRSLRTLATVCDIATRGAADAMAMTSTTKEAGRMRRIAG
ncbi:hypothetical protein [Nocardia arizonensis]|uniref:hypothetical protein n=1 Tax=Nocardia arizonensis TaxID=1141647 RepID=UPI000AB6AC41|nr:hypothetical protein [Nocardia arizonensis]